uniref:Uncharacterized protein n=1 Tax=Papio anubis TaxID=9555 RepID=A0A8I5NPF2_PAPAN
SPPPAAPLCPYLGGSGHRSLPAPPSLAPLPRQPPTSLSTDPAPPPAPPRPQPPSVIPTSPTPFPPSVTVLSDPGRPPPHPAPVPAILQARLTLAHPAPLLRWPGPELRAPAQPALSHPLPLPLEPPPATPRHPCLTHSPVPQARAKRPRWALWTSTWPGCTEPSSATLRSTRSSSSASRKSWPRSPASTCEEWAGPRCRGEAVGAALPHPTPWMRGWGSTLWGLVPSCTLGAPAPPKIKFLQHPFSFQSPQTPEPRKSTRCALHPEEPHSRRCASSEDSHTLYWLSTGSLGHPRDAGQTKPTPSTQQDPPNYSL